MVQAGRDALAQCRFDVDKMTKHSGADNRHFDLAEFENQRGDDVVLFGHRLAHEKLPCLAVMIGKGRRPLARFGATDRGGKAAESGLVILARS